MGFFTVNNQQVPQRAALENQYNAARFSLILMVMIPNLPAIAINVIAVIDTIFMLISFMDYLITYFKRENKFQSLEDPS